MSLHSLIALLRAPDPPQEAKEPDPMTPTTTPPPEDMTLVQPGVRPRIGQIVHAYDPANDKCRVALVRTVFERHLTLRVEPGSPDPVLLLLDPRHGDIRGHMPYDAAPEKVTQPGMPGQPKPSWHRAGPGCPFGR